MTEGKESKKRKFIDDNSNENEDDQILKNIEKKIILPEIISGINNNFSTKQIISDVKKKLERFSSLPFTEDVYQHIFDLISLEREQYEYYKQFVQLEEEKYKYKLNLDFLDPFLLSPSGGNNNEEKERKEKLLSTSLFIGDFPEEWTSLNYILSKHYKNSDLSMVAPLMSPTSDGSNADESQFAISWNCTKFSYSTNLSPLDYYLGEFDKGINTTGRVITNVTPRLIDSVNVKGEKMIVTIKYRKQHDLPPSALSSTTSSSSPTTSFVSVEEEWTLTVPETILSLLQRTKQRTSQRTYGSLNLPHPSSYSSPHVTTPSHEGGKGEASAAPYAVFYLYLNDCKKSSSHANAMIYDRRENTLERFEPNGAIAEGFSQLGEKFSYIILDQVLDLFFTSFFHGNGNQEEEKGGEKKFKYIPSNLICPSFGFQLIESSEQSSTLIGDPGGFCSAWTLFYIDARLSNPDIPPDILLDLLLDRLAAPAKERDNNIEKIGSSEEEGKVGGRSNTNTTTGGRSRGLKNFIRQYSNFILLEGLKLLPTSEEKTEEKKMEERRNKIVVVDGTPWSLEAFRSNIVDSNNSIIDEIDELDHEVPSARNERLKLELSRQLSQIVSLSNLIRSGDNNYQEVVKLIKERINLAGIAQAKNIYFLGNYWFPISSNPASSSLSSLFFSSNFPSSVSYKSLFENIDADRKYVSDVKDVLPWLISPILGIENINSVNKILDMLPETIVSEIYLSMVTMINNSDNDSGNLKMIRQMLKLIDSNLITSSSTLSSKTMEVKIPRNLSSEQYAEFVSRLKNKQLQNYFSQMLRK